MYFSCVTLCNYLSELSILIQISNFKCVGMLVFVCVYRLNYITFLKAHITEFFQLDICFFINSKIKIISHMIIKFCFLTFYYPYFRWNGIFGLNYAHESLQFLLWLTYIDRHGLYRYALWPLFVIFISKTKQQIHDIIGVINNRCTCSTFSLE